MVIGYAQKKTIPWGRTQGIAADKCIFFFQKKK
jgi:hypothetical protein